MDRVKDYLEENYEELLKLETKILNKLNGIETPEEHVELVNENIEEFDNQLKEIENEY